MMLRCWNPRLDKSNYEIKESVKSVELERQVEGAWLSLPAGGKCTGQIRRADRTSTMTRCRKCDDVTEKEKSCETTGATGNFSKNDTDVYLTDPGQRRRVKARTQLRRAKTTLTLSGKELDCEGCGEPQKEQKNNRHN